MAFKTLHDAICNKPVLQQPDFTKPFYVLTDALLYGVRAILLQEGESTVLHIQTPHKKLKLHPIAYYSATFTKTECNYDHHESYYTLEAIPHLDRETFHNLYRSCEPTLLEIFTQIKLQNSLLALRTPG